MNAIASILWMAFYIVIFTPLSAAYRLIWTDPLRLQSDTLIESYWQERADHQFHPMTRQY